jgi:hypothetical protein
MFGIDDAIVADLGMNLMGNMFADQRQSDQQSFNREQQFQSQSFNSAQAAANRDWQEKMSNTAYQRSVKDLEAAGLNPMLAYTHTGASTPGGSSASSSPASSGIASPGSSGNIPAAMQTASNIQLNEAAADRTRAEADRARAEKNEIEARTPTHAVTRDQMEQNIRESESRIQKIIQETSTSAYSAANIAQQTENLKAIIPQINATVNSLKAHTQLAGSQDADLRQRIEENLPKLQAALQRLEQQSRLYDMPRQGNDALSHSGTLGQIGSILRSLLPFGKK